MVHKGGWQRVGLKCSSLKAAFLSHSALGYNGVIMLLEDILQVVDKEIYNTGCLLLKAIVPWKDCQWLDPDNQERLIASWECRIPTALNLHHSLPHAIIMTELRFSCQCLWSNCLCAFEVRPGSVKGLVGTNGPQVPSLNPAGQVRAPS
eukprot:1161716-Pelagomonas_calceolata.AAC.2